MSTYLYAVQDSQGREVCSAKVDVERVSEVTAHLDGDRVVLFGEERGELGSGPAVQGETYTLYRWPADDKLANPVRHPVR